MQYAVMQGAVNPSNPNDVKHFLVDACELYALENPSVVKASVPEGEQNFELKVVYGRYKTNPLHDSVSLKSRENYIHSTLDKWLAYVPPHEDEVLFLGFEDIVVNTSVALTTNCGHCPKPHPSDDLVFAALVRVPEGFTLAKNPSRARSAFLFYSDMSLESNIVNRDGLFALISEEKRDKTVPTIDNWKNRVDWKRVVRNANKVK